jgi:1,4-dihydroxy-2-naphthoyl-CoA hydrolase
MSMTASIQEKVKGLLPDLMGIKFTDVTPDKVVATLAVRKDLCTLGDNLHGGAIMAFADTLGAVVAILNMPQGARTTTIESKTNFIGGAPMGTAVTGESVAVHKGRTSIEATTRSGPTSRSSMPSRPENCRSSIFCTDASMFMLVSPSLI